MPTATPTPTHEVNDTLAPAHPEGLYDFIVRVGDDGRIIHRTRSFREASARAKALSIDETGIGQGQVRQAGHVLLTYRHGTDVFRDERITGWYRYSRVGYSGSNGDTARTATVTFSPKAGWALKVRGNRSEHERVLFDGLTLVSKEDAFVVGNHTMAYGEAPRWASHYARV